MAVERVSRQVVMEQFDERLRPVSGEPDLDGG
jgi:hypothetical protein